eukprot:Partr_v1_DN28834_c0_g1_i2_m32916 putative DDT domain protein
MPLLQDKPFPLAEQPSESDIPPDVEEVWQIRFTGEIFTSYDDYYFRLYLYRQRIWTCSITNNSGLTFEEALMSEKKIRTVPNKLSFELQREILRLAQFSTISRMDSLVDFVYNSLKDRFVEGEEVMIKKSDNYQHPAVIRKVVLVSPPALTSDGAEIPAVFKYTVSDVVGDNRAGKTQLIEADASKLSRARNAISKAVLKPFLKESTSRETFIGAPWIVREDLSTQFNISTIPPPDIWDAEKKEFRRRKKPSRSTGGKPLSDPAKLPKPKFPVEDSEVPIYVRNNSHPEMETSAVPLPKCEFKVSAALVPSMIHIWSFLYSYADPLALFPFSFDDFELAVLHSEVPVNPLLTEIHKCLLDLATKATAEMLAKLSKAGVKVGKLIAKSSSIAKSKQDVAEDASDVHMSDAGGHMANGSAESHDELHDVDNEQETEGDNMGREDNLIVNIMDYSYVGAWWKWKVNDESWISSVLALLFHQATVRDFPTLPDIIHGLTGESPILDTVTGRLFLQSKYPWKNGDLLERYCELDVSHKLDILSFIISESVVHSNAIRKFIENCTTQLQDLKKEKRELDMKQKEMREEHRALENQSMETDDDQPVPDKAEDHQIAEEDDEEGVAEVEESDYSSDEEDEAEDSNDARLQELKEKLERFENDEITVSRQEKVRMQTEIRELEESQRRERLAAARAAAREKNAENRARLNQKKKLDSAMAAVLSRNAELDRGIRTMSGCLRLKPLGRDRFWNNYWWFDGYGSSVPVVYEHDVEVSAHKINQMLKFGSGRLWVEGSGNVDYLGQVSGGAGGGFRRRKRVVAVDAPKPVIKEAEDIDAFVTIPRGYADMTPGQAIGKNWLSEGEWRYYDDIDQVCATSLIEFKLTTNR